MITYDNSPVRRQDRLLDENSAEQLLASGEYGFLSFGDQNGGYGIPINYAYDKDKLYFHCAPEGRKLEYVDNSNSVSFCVVGKTQVQPSKFTTGYESVLISGKIWEVTNDPEKMHALELLIDKYSPDFKEKGRKYAQKSFDRTKILRLDISKASGKTKEVFSSSGKEY